MPTKTTIQFRQHYNALLDLLLPKQCPLCRQFCFDHGLCADCWQGLVFITPHFCQCCGRPLAYAIGDHLCGSCFAKMPPLAEIRSCFLYNDRSRQLILKFKHGDALHLNKPICPIFISAFHRLGRSRPSDCAASASYQTISLSGGKWAGSRAGLGTCFAQWIITSFIRCRFFH